MANVSTMKPYVESLLNINIQFFSKILKVNRMTTNNIHPTGLNCDGLSIPTIDMTIGIPNSDLHIYVNSLN